MEPMHTIGADGAAFMDVLRQFLDSGMITVVEFERETVSAHRIWMPFNHHQVCEWCSNDATWRRLDIFGRTDDDQDMLWELLCSPCMSLLTVSDRRLDYNDPWVVEPLGTDVYDPDIAIVLGGIVRDGIDET